jgi:hypothetical protein
MHHNEHQSQGKVLIGPVKIKIIRAKKVQKAKRKGCFAKTASAKAHR